MAEYLLDIQHATKIFSKQKKKTVALNDVSCFIEKGTPKTLAVVGESGSGKSTLANQILGFQKLTSGKIFYNNMDIAHLNRKERKLYRQQVQAIFQNPFDTFNPFYTVDHVFHLLVEYFGIAEGKKQAVPLIEETLEMVRLDPHNVLGKYSYQLSGGQLQRIMIARCLLLKPKLLIADEPVSMIDASLRVTVLSIMEQIKRENQISQIYITHDLSTALQISDDIIVMYRGHIVEYGDASEVIRNPKHPYTQLLIQCIPLPSPEERWTAPINVKDSNLIVESGQACCFVERCPYAKDKCFCSKPAATDISAGHGVSCFCYSDKEYIRTIE